MPKPNRYEQALRDIDVIKFGDFTAHNGEAGNCKVDLDVLFEDEHRELAAQIAARLAKKLEPYDPELILPVPKGANRLGAMVGRELGARVVYLDWRDKSAGQLTYEDYRNRIVVCRAQRVAIVDDVFRTGSSYEQVISFAELDRKEVFGGVVWDRSNPKKPWRPDIPIQAVVSKFMPLYVKSENIK